MPLQRTLTLPHIPITGLLMRIDIMHTSISTSAYIIIRAGQLLNISHALAWLFFARIQGHPCELLVL